MILKCLSFFQAQSSFLKLLVFVEASTNGVPHSTISWIAFKSLLKIVKSKLKVTLQFVSLT